MNVFCTYCDRQYVARLFCLYESLRAHRESFRLFVLCFDSETETVVSAAKNSDLVALPLSELCDADQAYAAVKSTRTKIEFYFTATPVLVRYCFAREKAATRITYLDSDLFFFGPPSAVFREQGEAAIGLVGHRFPARLSQLASRGTFNVAWVSFTRDQDGLAAVDWWRKMCLAWCFDRVENGRYADQGYLDDFPRRFRGVRVLDHVGIDAAPWNMDGRIITRENGEVRIDGKRLLFYHFQGVRELAPGWFEAGLRNYQTTLSRSLRDLVYIPYLKEMTRHQAMLRMNYGINPALGYQRVSVGKSWPERLERVAARWIWPVYRRLRGQLLHCPEPRVQKLPLSS